MELTHIYRYPVKSCGGESLENVELNGMGLPFDREWMVVDENNCFLTQRSRPKMTLIRAEISGEKLVIRAPGVENLTIEAGPTPSRGEAKTVEIWGKEHQALDLGSAPAEWFSIFLDMPCRLVRFGGQQLTQRWSRNGMSTPVRFPDGYPFHLIGTASLGELSRRLGGETVQPLRFRPNLIVSTGIPHEEDQWSTIKIGETVLLGDGKPCVRCGIPAINPRTSERGKEPLTTLANYRRNPTGEGLIFGVYFNHRITGKLKVGDKVTNTHPLTT